MSYKIFIMSDPTPWLDQLIETAGVMVKKNGGISVEFIINNMLNRMGQPNHLVLAACEEGRPATLVGWMNVIYIQDTKAPWVEVWALWIKTGLGLTMRDLGWPILLDWAHAKGAKKIVAIVTRSSRAMRKVFHQGLGFEQVAVVIEKGL